MFRVQMFQLERYIDGANVRNSLLVDEVVESLGSIERRACVKGPRICAHNLLAALLIDQNRLSKAQSKLLCYVERHMLGVPDSQYRRLLP